MRALFRHEFEPHSLAARSVAAATFTFYACYDVAARRPKAGAIGVFIAIVACVTSCSFAVFAADNEMIKDKSPDGKLALRIGQQDDSGYSKREIVSSPVCDEERAI
jgi:hypothetical protein